MLEPAAVAALLAAFGQWVWLSCVSMAQAVQQQWGRERGVPGAGKWPGMRKAPCNRTTGAPWTSCVRCESQQVLWE